MSKNNGKKLMDKKSPKKFSTMFGWWVGLGVSSKNKMCCFGSACGRENSSFNFAKRWLFSVRLLSVVSVF
jgi:hypothetical protein